MSFGAFVYPCLVFAYLGQGARLISDGAAVLPNIFYLTIPGGVNTPLYWYERFSSFDTLLYGVYRSVSSQRILFVFAILASVSLDCFADRLRTAESRIRLLHRKP
jgi:hypothetical protein